MIKNDTPVEWYPQAGIWVKREDLSCDGPRFSKTRGVLAHIRNRPEYIIGVLDTAHSQGGWAVARACKELGRECHVWYPWYKGQQSIPDQQIQAERLGAVLHPLKAGRSAILYHAAKRELADLTDTNVSSYMMPNALKLPETVEETVAEVERTNERGFMIPDSRRERGVRDPYRYWIRYIAGRVNLHMFENVLVSCSSGTIAAGVVRGLNKIDWRGNVYFHMGYDRPAKALFRYIENMSGVYPRHPDSIWGIFVNEGYAYKDKAPKGVEAPFPCNSYYDLKLWAWWLECGRKEVKGETLMWNVG